MKILVNQMTESPKDLSFAEGTEELNRIYSGERAKEFRFPPLVDVRVVYYRSGRELFFHGSVGGMVEGACSRCLKIYSFALEKKFDFVLTPDPFSVKSKELDRDEMGLSFYSEEEINLSPYIREQVLLALPMRPLCDEECRGLCSGCGADLNDEPCRCVYSRGDPRMAPFRTMKLDQ
jgi:uncharacterized protein